MVTDAERAQHEAALRGLLYLACPDAPAAAITRTAHAIAQGSEETPHEPVPEATFLRHPRPAYGRLRLAGADLSGADLPGEDLTSADLPGADLSDANLAGADLTSVNLSDANLAGADLSDANLRGANLRGANLVRANLSGTNLQYVLGMFQAPPGATWSRQTQWPHQLASIVAEQSDEVRPGVFQVRGEQTPDRSGMVRV
ncbi:pentapeptide repeat-containing protein [Streptomyces sp. NPDC127084]|uniref:pentapeptide repeat-containing protein n=1 Tax=Streptomyces sp. NPDC127084 TaxID=3347133 RepID=UPI003667BC41